MSSILKVSMCSALFFNISTLSSLISSFSLDTEEIHSPQSCYSSIYILLNWCDKRTLSFLLTFGIYSLLLLIRIVWQLCLGESNSFVVKLGCILWDSQICRSNYYEWQELEQKSIKYVPSWLHADWKAAHNLILFMNKVSLMWTGVTLQERQPIYRKS